ncbi:unnamed protein product, partial [Owenia fusiformis]
PDFKMIANAKRSLFSFLLGASIVVVPLLAYTHRTLYSIITDWYIYILIGYVAAVNLILLGLYKGGQAFQVVVRGGGIGVAFGAGLILSFSDNTVTHFGWYLTFLAFFHWSEYFTTAVCNPHSLTLESYLLNHSREYKIAAVSSWIEFAIEWYFFPGLKQFRFISFIGLLLMIFGESLRKIAMVTARANFNHYVQHVKEEGHTLVTHGVYQYTRHPSYVGWFYWSIGTQLTLCNPLCIVAYTGASWMFFKARIYDEEISLLNFFGEDYLDYKQKVGTGLPWIKGYKVEP